MADSSGDYNHLPGIIAALQQAAREIVRKGALDVEGHAKALAAVDTGFMRSSIYTVTTEGSGYGNHLTGGGPGAHLLPEIEGPENDQTAYVAVGADYGIYQEFGTVHHPAHPFMAPAVEAVRPSYEAAWARLEERLRAVR